MSGAPRQKVPLREQIAEAKRIVADRTARFPGFVAKGMLSPADSNARIESATAIVDTLEWLERLRDEVIELYHELRTDAFAGGTPEHERAFLEHPIVAAVLNQFPGAEVVAVRPISKREEATS